MTSADVKEIQDRNALARGRVIDAASAPDLEPAQRIEAAMMELAAVWREEAAHVTKAGRKGHIGIAKEYTQAAARLAGFAIGLTTRPVLTNSPVLVATKHGGPWKTADGTEYPTEEAMDDVSHLHAPFYGCTRHELCTALPDPFPKPLTIGEAEDYRDLVGLTLTKEVLAALPAGDPVAAVFTSPVVCEHPAESQSLLKNGSTKCVACGLIFISDEAEAMISAAMTGDEPVGTQVTVAGVEFTKIGTDPFGSDQGEEQNLRDIIGSLGVTATIDHPFTNPGVPWLNKARAVDVVPYAQLPLIALATPSRDHVSHSYVETYEGCSLSAMLRDASRAGHIGASRPGWSMIGGTAFHNAVEMIERMALSGVTIADDPEALWLQHFDAAVKERLDELVGTPYADSATWYISNRGKEGFDWWRVEGAKMLALYVKHHNDAWRAANPTFLLQDATPVIEYEYSMTLRSLDGERGLTANGFVDRATLDMATYSLTVIDYKSGSREPESTFQLGEYGHALLMAMGIPGEPPDRPILGRYWLARKGIYTDPVPVVTRHPLTELQYRYDAAARGNQARIFAPHVTNLCKSCSVTDYCPAQAGRA